MINLFTYLSFTNVAIGQLYQYFIIALLSVIILYSTYLSLKKLPSSIQIKDNFHLIFIGFVTIILNIGLFFVFLYLTKYSFFTTVLWFPVFSFIIHVIDITAQSILASTILIVRVSHKNVLRIVFSLFMAYFFILLLTIVFFLLPTTSKLVYKYLLQTNYLILVCNFVYIITVLGFLGISKLKANPFLSLGIASLVTAYAYYSITILYPPAIRYLIVYNLLIILGYILIEIFIFYEIIRELSEKSLNIESLNYELESKIKDRTQELYSSNKELFHANYMLHQEKEKLNTIIENLEEGIIVTNISHTILMINGSTKTLMDINKNYIGGSLSDIILDKDYIQDMSQIILKKTRMISKEIIVTNQHKEKLYISLRSSLSSDSKGNIIGVITLLRDITKEVEIEQLKTGFFRTISHELKTPLTNIIGFSETLVSERRGKLNDNQKNYTDIILKESLHLNKLINDILEFSIMTSNKLSICIEEISLKALISGILDSFRPQAGAKNLDIIFDESVNLPTIQADREKITKAFVNIITNALFYTQKGFIKASFITEKNKIITKISDSGIGISPEDSERIFDTFIQVDQKKDKSFRNGLGLGLSIARDLIGLHNGKIWLESTVGEGSSFFVELPISQY